MDQLVDRLSVQEVNLSAGHIGSAVRKIATGITPARYLVHNILADNLMAIRE